ncbi:hypothetical protein [Sutcliffiella sp. BMC8]|uniref:hypothetical protein n=1 Tax=Sutcliffiella sp. BMC8 TaxID=3073243 RepID=UPI0030CE06A7
MSSIKHSKLVVATIVCGVALSSPAMALNKEELKDFNELSQISPAMAKLVSGMEFSNPEKVEEALTEFNDLGDKEKFLTLPC